MPKFRRIWIAFFLERDHSVDVDTISGLGVRPPLPHENQAIRFNADFNLLNGLRTEHRTDELDDDVVLRLQNPAGERRKDFAFRGLSLEAFAGVSVSSG